MLSSYCVPSEDRLEKGAVEVDTLVLTNSASIFGVGVVSLLHFLDEVREVQLRKSQSKSCFGPPPLMECDCWPSMTELPLSASSSRTRSASSCRTVGTA